MSEQFIFGWWLVGTLQLLCAGLALFIMYLCVLLVVNVIALVVARTKAAAAWIAAHV